MRLLCRLALADFVSFAAGCCVLLRFVQDTQYRTNVRIVSILRIVEII